MTLLHSAKAWLANKLVNKTADTMAFNLMLQNKIMVGIFEAELLHKPAVYM